MSEIVRAFLSIDINNNEIVSNVLNVQRKLDTNAAKMKLVEAENIHYTMRFFGDTKLDRIQDIKNNLEKIRFEPFDIEIIGVGAFPNKYRPRVIWIGTGLNGNRITTLKKDIDQCLIELGYQPEKKFTPHATIARIKYVKDPKQLSLNLEELGEESIGLMKVSNVSMKKSTLTQSGPIYETLWKIPVE